MAGGDGDGCQLIIAQKDAYRWQIKTYESDRRLQFGGAYLSLLRNSCPANEPLLTREDMQ